MAKQIRQTLNQMLWNCIEAYPLADIVDMLRLHLELTDSQRFTSVILKLEEAVDMLLETTSIESNSCINQVPQIISCDFSQSEQTTQIEDQVDTQDRNTA